MSKNAFFVEKITMNEEFMAEPQFEVSLLELLVCPVTKGPLVYDEETQELISERAALAYPIRDGIPILLKEEARQLAS
jgi:uncharacterized protein YbaR (Trm112 family)